MVAQQGPSPPSIPSGPAAPGPAAPGPTPFSPLPSPSRPSRSRLNSEVHAPTQPAPSSRRPSRVCRCSHAAQAAGPVQEVLPAFSTEPALLAQTARPPGPGPGSESATDPHLASWRCTELEALAVPARLAGPQESGSLRRGRSASPSRPPAGLLLARYGRRAAPCQLLDPAAGGHRTGPHRAGGPRRVVRRTANA